MDTRAQNRSLPLNLPRGDDGRLLVPEIDADERPITALEASGAGAFDAFRRRFSAEDADVIGRVTAAFLDVISTSMGRASFYNSLADQEAAEEEIHRALFEIDRGLYGAILALSGTTDRARQLGAVRLLAHPRTGAGALLDAGQEKQLLRWLTRRLRPTRRLKMFGMLKRQRVNNARTRKLILRSLLNSRKLELWSVRYRVKLGAAIEHAIGQQMTGVIRKIMARPPEERPDDDQKLLYTRLGKFAGDRDLGDVYECVGFVLGVEDHLTLPLLCAYRDAKDRLEAGAELPYETLEGIRSTYHPDRSSDEVLELTRGQLTQGQKLGLQRKAEEADVEVEFDPADHDAVRLYLYACERGMDAAIRGELARKAQAAAARLPVELGDVGVLLDTSASMAGDETQALRPMATALALRDVLMAAGSRATVACTGGADAGSPHNLLLPEGETRLADGLVELLQAEPDTVFILSDGYENTPAGRVREVVRAVRSIGITTPIYQLSPVFAAESGGVRALAEGLVPALPVSRPEALHLSFVRGLLEAEPVRGLSALIQMALPRFLAQ